MDVIAKLKEMLGEKFGEFEKFLDGKEIILNDGKYIPKDRLDAEIKKRDDLKAEIKTLTENAAATEKQIAELKKTAGTTEEMKAKITELETNLKTKSTEIAETKKKMLLDAKKTEALLAAGVSKEDVALLMAGFDESKIAVSADFGSVTGIDTQVPALKEKHPKLFGGVKVEGTPNVQPKPGQNGLYTKEQLNAMTQEQVLADYDNVMKSHAALSSK
jgi:hypothetical protein